MHNFFLVAVVLGMVIAPALRAQPAAKPPTAENPRQQTVREFERKAPQVGENLPELPLLDENGQSFSLASLRGHHTVLVFGCLT